MLGLEFHTDVNYNLVSRWTRTFESCTPSNKQITAIVGHLKWINYRSTLSLSKKSSNFHRYVNLLQSSNSNNFRSLKKIYIYININILHFSITFNEMLWLILVCTKEVISQWVSCLKRRGFQFNSSDRNTFTLFIFLSNFQLQESGSYLILLLILYKKINKTLIWTSRK